MDSWRDERERERESKEARETKSGEVEGCDTLNKKAHHSSVVGHGSHAVAGML